MSTTEQQASFLRTLLNPFFVKLKELQSVLCSPENFMNFIVGTPQEQENVVTMRRRVIFKFIFNLFYLSSQKLYNLIFTLRNIWRRIKVRKTSVGTELVFIFLKFKRLLKTSFILVLFHFLSLSFIFCLLFLFNI